MPELPPDIVDRAIARLLSTPGPAEVPVEVTQRVLSAIQEFESVQQVQRDDHRSLTRQVAWLPLSACIMVVLMGSWIAGFHSALLSAVAGRRVSPDGTVWVHYTDGRVIAHAGS